METKHCTIKSEPFGVFSDSGSINFKPQQKIVSAYLKNEGTTNVVLYNGLVTITPQNFFALGNNSYLGFVRADIIDFDFSGTGTDKLTVLIDKIIR